MDFNVNVEVKRTPLTDPALASRVVNEEMARGVENALIALTGPVVYGTPVNFGILVGSIAATSASELLSQGPSKIGKISTPIEYGRYVEWGTNPHWAPIAPLKLWAKRKLGDENIAYAIQKAIKKRGTKGKKMFGNAYVNKHGAVMDILGRIGERIAARLRG